MGLRFGGLAPALVAILLVACEGDGDFIAGSPGGGNLDNPIPTIDLLSPSSGAVGDHEFTLTVLGSNFVGGSLVKWNGVALVSTFIDATHLTAIVPADRLAAAGPAIVVVSNSPPGGGNSGAHVFNINSPAPGAFADPAAFGDATLRVAGADCTAAFGASLRHWWVLAGSADALLIDEVVIVPQDSSLIGTPMWVTATAIIDSGGLGPQTVSATTADLLFGSAFHFSV